MDGVDAFPDEDAPAGEHGNESSCTRLQHEACDESIGGQRAHRSDGGLRPSFALKTR